MNLKVSGIALLMASLAACGGSEEPAAPTAEAPPAAESEGANVEKIATEAAEADPTGITPSDYSNEANWLCLPGKEGDHCETADLTTTVVDVQDGEVVVSEEFYEAAADPAIDCFYVYPTSSVDQTGNSDMIADEAGEIVTVVGQFARFGSVCKTYAPMYRSVTLKALRARMAGQQVDADPAIAQADVVAAWNYYLENYNDGRGVVLVGHSQGSSVLQGVLATEIIGKPSQDLIVSAMPTGITYPADENGGFMGMPACENASDTGCIIAYSSFREDVPPSKDSFFGVNSSRGDAMCVNPAEVSGDDGMLIPYLANEPDRAGNVTEFAKGVEIDTPFVKLPGLISAECVSNDTHNWLAYTTMADPTDDRTDTYGGDIFNADGSINTGWGLHLLDMHAPMGNLLKIVEAQSAAWEAKSE
tara:strand:+ start:4957 stop:6207 length:1251 start_codon:yes stop_codon:yes gene_type:complete